jgi:hypothetical protein
MTVVIALAWACKSVVIICDNKFVASGFNLLLTASLSSPVTTWEHADLWLEMQMLLKGPCLGSTIVKCRSHITLPANSTTYDTYIHEGDRQADVMAVNGAVSHALFAKAIVKEKRDLRYIAAKQITLADQVDARWVEIKKQGNDSLCDEHEEFDDPSHAVNRNPEISDEQLCALLQPHTAGNVSPLLIDAEQTHGGLLLQRSAKWRYNVVFVGAVKQYLSQITLCPGEGGGTTFLEMLLDFVGTTGVWPTHRGKSINAVESNVSTALAVFIAGVTNLASKWNLPQLAPATRTRINKLSAFGVPKQQIAIGCHMKFVSPLFVHYSLIYMRNNTTSVRNLNFDIPRSELPAPKPCYYMLLPCFWFVRQQDPQDA